MRRLGWAVAALAAVSCAPKTHELVVSIATDLTAPDELDSIRFQSDGPRGTQTLTHAIRGTAGDPFGLPNTVVLYTDDDSTPTITADLVGLQNGQEVVIREAVFPLVAGPPRLVRMALESSCRAVVCFESDTCVDGLCTYPALTAGQLPLDQPRLERAVACDGPAKLIDTSAHDPVAPIGAGCATGQFCLEGLCYLGAPPTAFGFSASETIPLGDPSLGAGCFADINGDGVPDLITGGLKGSGLRVLPGSQDGTLGALADLTAEPGDLPYDIVAADFDGDALPDLAVATARKGVVVLTGAKAYQQASAIPIAGAALRLAAADFDGDGNGDLIVGTQPDLLFAHGNGDGTFAAPVSVAQLPGGVVSLTTGDFNGDGLVDLAAADGTAYVYLGDGAGHFTQTYSYTGPENGPASERVVSGVAAADFDRDARTDLAIAHHGGRIMIALGNGQGGFRPVDGGPADVENWTRIAIGDLDGDGLIDVVGGVTSGSNSAQGLVAAFLNQGDGTLREVFGLSMSPSGPSLLLLQSFGGRPADLVVNVARTDELRYLTNRFRAP